MLKARQLSFHFAPKVPLLQDISLTLCAGQWLGLSGDSGAGKSTLGQLLAGYLAPQAGDVTLDGEALPKSGVQPVQWLPQSPELAAYKQNGCRASLNRYQGESCSGYACCGRSRREYAFSSPMRSPPCSTPLPRLSFGRH